MVKLSENFPHSDDQKSLKITVCRSGLEMTLSLQVLRMKPVIMRRPKWGFSSDGRQENTKVRSESELTL